MREPPDEPSNAAGEHAIVLRLIGSDSPLHGDWEPSLELPDELADIEVQLVEGPVLEDYLHVTDYSRISPDDDGSRTLCQYQSIADVLTGEELARYRERVAALLDQLKDEGDTWVLFCCGAPVEDGRIEQNYTDVFTAYLYCDELEANGACTILDARHGIAHYRELLGRSDAVAGLRCPEGSFARVLRQISLDAALPTSRRYRPSSPYHLTDTRALARLFAIGSLWFEEIDNGTRLRFVTRREQWDALWERITVLTGEGEDEDEDEDEDEADATPEGAE